MHFNDQDRAGRTVRLSEIDDENWRAVADIAPQDDQRRFVAALGARYLLLSMRGGVWHSLAVLADTLVVGHLMWAYDQDDDSHWIGGMMIDAAQQGRGTGRVAVLTLMRQLADRPDCREIRLSCHPDNLTATRLYRALGFEPTGEQEDDEIVLAIAAKSVPDGPAAPV